MTLVDCATGLCVASAGREDVVDRHENAAGTTEVVRAILADPAMSSTSTGDDIEEIIVCGANGYHLLAAVGTSADALLFLHLLIDRTQGNLALARHRLQTMVQEMAGPERAR
ncbi:hypothetical protein [Actinoallomurus vinaceus]|uniref:hypothetical protein n=1 Tax=Actinoallomurus vinaceus TaxID=1080074 RepID=UPI0031EDFD9B